MRTGTDELEVTVVIPAFKRSELLRKTLDSVLAQDIEGDCYEIIVVDSSPNERNATLIKEFQTSASRDLYLIRKVPEGPGPSRSLGVQKARGRYIAFIDSDCQATPGWLRAGLSAFEDGIGIVQGRTLPNPDQPVGVFTRYVQVEGENWLFDAANIFYRKECFEAGGALSKDMTPTSERPTGGEDTLVAWRAKRKGWRSIFTTDALVYHEVLPVGIGYWFVDKRHYMLPWLIGEVPELRRLFFLRYFLDSTHALLVLALLGAALGIIHWVLLVLCLPYVARRLLEPSRTFTGMRRVVRLFVYLPRDLLSLALLSLGSIRYGTVLL